jgi:tetratricopeptide (TPR) repeat protein
VIRATNLKGLIAFSRGDYPKAKAYHQKAVQLDLKDATAHNNLGIVDSDQHKLDEAIAEHQKAIPVQEPSTGQFTNQQGSRKRSFAEVAEDPSPPWAEHRCNEWAGGLGWRRPHGGPVLGRFPRS